MNGQIVYGRGRGKTKESAEKAAIKDVNDNYVPRGTKAKHCRITDSFNQKSLLKIPTLGDL